MSTNTEPAQGQQLEVAEGWHKSWTWWDGFVLMLPLVGGGVWATSGLTIGAIGAYGALAVLGIMCIVALLTNFLFSEMATMFPDKTGGMSMYPREALRRYFIPGGVLAAFGYWLGYAVSISFVSASFAQLVVYQWFPTNTWTVHFAGNDLMLWHFISAAVVIVAFLLAIVGVKVMSRLSFWVGCIALVFVAIVMIGPWVTGKADTANLTWHMGGWKSALVWCYIAGWTLFGSELAAAFSPEYKNAKKDVPRALISSAMFTLVLYTLTPLSAAALMGEKAIGEHFLIYGPLAATMVMGGGQLIFTLIYLVSLGVSILVFTADCARATAGMAEEGAAPTQLAKLNRFGVPFWGAVLPTVVNLAMIFLIANPVGIILASNLGYILCHALANWSYVVLRITQPDTPRPIKLYGPVWMPIAVILGTFHIVILWAGITSPDLVMYGGNMRQTWIGVGFLCVGLLLWVWRVVLQDHKPLRMREPAPQVAPVVAS